MDSGSSCNEVVGKCYRCTEPVISSLNVVNNASNTTIILWNKFQIFVYENHEFTESTLKVIVPEFQIRTFIICSNYILCLDYTGNIHTSSLKFKNAAQKSYKKFCFHPRKQNVIACALFDENQAICLQHESNAYSLSVHKINTEFNLEKEISLICSEELPYQQIPEKILFKSFTVTRSYMKQSHLPFKTLFNISDTTFKDNYQMVVISLDKLCAYICFVGSKTAEEEVTLIKLYSCPSEITNIDIIETDCIHIIIGLRIGTIINLNIKDLQTPEVIHLNTAIYKFITFDKNILYTDGISMWMAKKVLTREIKFSQLFVKNVNDFIKYGDLIICTTFDNLVYTFSIDNDKTFIKQLSNDEYCVAEELIGSDKFDVYMKKIFDEVKKSKALVYRQRKQQNYINTLALANRQDIMDRVIYPHVYVYDNYDDAIAENPEIKLTQYLSEYFDKDSFYFLVKISASTEHRLYNLLIKSLRDLRVHISIISDHKVVKTITVTASLLKGVTLLLPLKMKLVNPVGMRVDLKIITSIPGAYDLNQKMWCVLYRKPMILSSQHFIRFKTNITKNNCLKEAKQPLEELILLTTKNQYGNLIEFVNIPKQEKVIFKWNKYVTLPSQYQELLRKEKMNKHPILKKEAHFLKQIACEDFLSAETDISWTVVNEKVDVRVDNDGFSNPCLKISCGNMRIAADMRNFVADLIFFYYTWDDIEPRKELIGHSYYDTIKTIRKTIKNIEGLGDEEILNLIEEFERKVIGRIPV